MVITISTDSCQSMMITNTYSFSYSTICPFSFSIQSSFSFTISISFSFFAPFSLFVDEVLVQFFHPAPLVNFLFTVSHPFSVSDSHPHLLTFSQGWRKYFNLSTADNEEDNRRVKITKSNIASLTILQIVVYNCNGWLQNSVLAVDIFGSVCILFEYFHNKCVCFYISYNTCFIIQSISVIKISAV